MLVALKDLIANSGVHKGLASITYVNEQVSGLDTAIKLEGGWQNWNTVHHNGSQLQLGTTAESARTALELGDMATEDTAEYTKTVDYSTTLVPEGTNLYHTTARVEAVLETKRNVAGGFAGLDANGKIATAQIPAIALTEPMVVSSQAAMLALTAQIGDIAIRTDVSKTFILSGNAATLADWLEMGGSAVGVSSFNGRTGVVNPTAGDYTFSMIGNTPTTLGGYGITDAAPKQHSHTINDIAELWDVLATKSDRRDYRSDTAATVTDWNNATTTGTFMASDGLNAPGAGWFIGNVTVHNPNWIQQELWNFTNGAETIRYYRHCMNGTWGAWTTSRSVGHIRTQNGAWATQQAQLSMGWNNGIVRWSHVLEADGTYALYSYDNSGGSPTRVYSLSSPVVGGTWDSVFDGNLMCATNWAHTHRSRGGDVGMKYFVGDDAGLADCGVAHMMAIWSQTDSNHGGLQLGYNGPTVTRNGSVWWFNNEVYAPEFSLSSDERLKTSISNFRAGDRLQPKWYRRLATGKAEYGFIAQQIQKVYPEVVSETASDGTLVVSISQIVAILAQEHNELEDEVMVLKETNEALMETVASLEDRLAALEKRLA